MLTDTVAEAKAYTFLHILGSVVAKGLIDTLADVVAKAKAGRPCSKPAHIKPEVLMNTLANTLVQPESDTLDDRGGS